MLRQRLPCNCVFDDSNFNLIQLNHYPTRNYTMYIIRTYVKIGRVRFPCEQLQDCCLFVNCISIYHVISYIRFSSTNLFLCFLCRQDLQYQFITLANPGVSHPLIWTVSAFIAYWLPSPHFRITCQTRQLIGTWKYLSLEATGKRKKRTGVQRGMFIRQASHLFSPIFRYIVLNAHVPCTCSIDLFL